MGAMKRVDLIYVLKKPCVLLVQRFLFTTIEVFGIATVKGIDQGVKRWSVLSSLYWIEQATLAPDERKGDR